MAATELRPDVGFVGLGVMGAGMAKCLLRTGWPLLVHARRTDVRDAFIALGARAATGLRELGERTSRVVLCVSDAAAVEAVLFADDGLAAGLRPGAIVVDTSTIAPASARAFAQRLGEHGVAYLDAPVSGGQQGAEQGALACMVGGAAQALEAVRPLLAAFCQSITHVGASGAGQAVKGCNQIAVAGAMLGVSEALAFARAQGVDPAVMRAVLLAGTARSLVLERHGQRAIVGDFQPGFRARLMRKDLRLVLEAAREHGVQLDGVAQVEVLLDALCSQGDGELDWSAVARELQRRSSL